MCLLRGVEKKNNFYRVTVVMIELFPHYLAENFRERQPVGIRQSVECGLSSSLMTERIEGEKMKTVCGVAVSFSELLCHY